MLLERRDLQYRCRMVLPCPIATPRVYYCPPGGLAEPLSPPPSPAAGWPQRYFLDGLAIHKTLR